MAMTKACDWKGRCHGEPASLILNLGDRQACLLACVVYPSNAAAIAFDDLHVIEDLGNQLVAGS